MTDPIHSTHQDLPLCQTMAKHDQEIASIDLLSPLTIRDITFRNRIGMSPMCQYSSEDGFANDWHLVHLGSRAVGGVGLVFVEATAVTQDGRISPHDMGIWKDEHIVFLTKIAQFIQSQGAIPCIQLAHAGRKASCAVPWKGGAKLDLSQGGWTTVAPSAIPFYETDPLPKELNKNDLQSILDAFELATKRALKAGFQVIEIHAAHGYLLHEFLSPLSNLREDEYGGSLENRMRFPLLVAKRLRQIIPENLPLFVRISATDWVEKGWDIQQSILFAKNLKLLGVDLIDVSSGGIVPKAHIPVAKGYQVPFATQISREAKIATAAVGLINEIQQANEIITQGQADLVFLGRELLRNPYWSLQAYQELGGNPIWPMPYGYAVNKNRK